MIDSTVFRKTASAVLAVVGITSFTQSHAQQWNPQPGWKDSYAVGGKCYCDSSNYDHNLDQKTAPTPVGELNVVEICNAIEARLGKGPTQGRIPYNDIQCGNGPANDAPDEAGCPGRVDIGPAGCNQIGPKWDLESVYGAWPGAPGGALDRTGWTVSSPQNGGQANLAIDGQQGTRWTTGTWQVPGQSFVLDLQSRRTFSSIVLDSGGSPNDYPRGYDIYVSNNGTNWGAPIRSGNGNGATMTIDVGSVTTRYLRIVQTGSAPTWWWSIHEINLVNNAAPAPNFTSSNTFGAGSAFQIEVVPNPLAGVQTVELFVNGQFLRTERQTPYQWGGGNQLDAGRLRSLAPGQHQLRARVTYSDGRTSTATQQLTLTGAEATPPPTPTPAPGPNAQFTSSNTFPAGNISQIQVVPNPLAGVVSVELFVNNQALRTERNSPYLWGGGVASDNARLQSLAAGQHQLRALVTYNDGRTNTATQQLTLTGGQATPPPTPTAVPTPLPTPPPPPTPVDQCNTTQQCRVLYGPQATDCRDSQSNTSVCMCGDSPCDASPPAPTPTPVVTPPPNPTVPPEPTPPPATTWKFCAREGGRCNFNGTSQVRYGAQGQYVTRTETNGVNCNNQTFGDPIPGVAKNCEVPSTTVIDTGPANAWSNPDTWGGQVPTGGNVTINAGQTVVLDMNVSLNGLTINGELRCADQDLALSARYIMVHGHFICGTEAEPYTKRAVITLTGNNRNENIMGMGTKLLGAMGSGRIDIHGETRTSWTRLGRTANPGDRTIRLSESPNWRVGDRIVITSTSENVNQNEERTITAISGNDVTLNQPLGARHFGERQMFSNDRGRVWDVETRGEVALLSRNILIQGDAQSQDNNPTHGFGGHIMVMQGSEAYISGVEMFRMGQTGILGRYPFHWHLAGDVTGQYITNSSIHQAYNRCVTVHGSHNALVQDNVCFKHLGHGYFLEDGFETGNVFDRNIAIRTFRPPANVALLPSDRMGNPDSGNSAVGPAGFWISHPDNIFTNNVAVGSDGLGFWYDTKDRVVGASRNAFPESQSVNPKTTPLGVFDDNVVHSSRMGFSICNGPGGHSGYRARREQPAVYNRLTAYNAGGGAIWPCRNYHVFNDFRILDSGSPGPSRTGSFVSPNAMTLQNSLFVANSKLTVPAKPRVAINLYDQGVYFKNVHFENYTFGSQSSVFEVNGGSEQFASTRVEGATFKNSPFISRSTAASYANLNSIVHDVDGSFGFGANRVLVPTQPNRADSRIYTTPNCQQIPNNNGIYICPGNFASMDIWTRRNGAGALKNRQIRVRNSQGVQFRRFHGPNNVIPWVSTLVPLDAQGTNRELTYFFDADTWNVADEIQLDIDRGRPGQSAYIKVGDVPGSIRVRNMQRVNSVNAVGNTPNSWHRSGSTLHINARLEGTDWAETRADVRIEW